MENGKECENPKGRSRMDRDGGLIYRTGYIGLPACEAIQKMPVISWVRNE